MATGAGNFERALGGVLAANVFEIDGIVLRLAEKRVTVNFQRQDAVAGVHEADDVEVDRYQAPLEMNGDGPHTGEVMK